MDSTHRKRAKTDRQTDRSLSTHWSSSFPRPSLPSAPQPQANTKPSLVVTTTWAGPDEMAVTSTLSSPSINLGREVEAQSP